MTVSLSELDAHQQPSDEMRAEWKEVSRLDPSAVVQDPRIDDPRLPPCENGFRPSGKIDKTQVAEAFAALGDEFRRLAQEDIPIIHHPLLPGLLIVPNLVPPTVQKALLARILHRDLSNPKHKTNLHLHYTLPYPSAASPPPDPDSGSDSSPPCHAQSFFTLTPASSATFTPKDPAVHKPLSPGQVLNRRLHWVTLGGQYDWTNRVYPDSEPPRFPADLSRFLEKLFPETRAQAAIVNFYSPKDTMMMHRDVSEETDRGLVSLSFGCECLFMIAPSDGAVVVHGEREREREQEQAQETGPDKARAVKRYLLLRLRSGDAIYMTKESRYAWHGVPKIIKDTCPEYLRSWPAEKGEYAEWEGWMRTKRINLNVRQMRD
ncbi:oxidoreductase [Metarhizium album ARSEF 1941]|uniref:mRNA N(6)-methyladenine demethylase n=1 Tax=Metarhizium album (strain ARSEF 1941) TaxID=1081103 RepID=A0A0B2WSL2_METAS|nr:oxidoreductase [Metarhizium album ARSEF 1941]KHN95940.1 oxidoreductase [Metarhizium album ARSEF 1941]